MGEEAVLNITYNGSNGDLPQRVGWAATDEEVRRFATEAVSTGAVPGIATQAANFNDFVVERFEATAELPKRLMLRPKVPFGAQS